MIICNPPWSSINIQPVSTSPQGLMVCLSFISFSFFFYVYSCYMYSIVILGRFPGSSYTKAVSHRFARETRLLLPREAIIGHTQVTLTDEIIRGPPWPGINIRPVSFIPQGTTPGLFLFYFSFFAFNFFVCFKSSSFILFSFLFLLLSLLVLKVITVSRIWLWIAPSAILC